MQFHCCAIVPLHYCTIALLHLRYCAIALLHYCTIVLLHYCPIALLFYCTVALLRHCAISPHCKLQFAMLSFKRGHTLQGNFEAHYSAFCTAVHQTPPFLGKRCDQIKSEGRKEPENIHEELDGLHCFESWCTFSTREGSGVQEP